MMNDELFNDEEMTKKQCSIWKLGFGIFFFILVSSFGIPAEAATWLDPALKWRTLETPHFSIHFHDGIEDIAKRFAPIAEEVHERLVPIMKHKPDLKTNVVLLDTVDYGNALTTVIPDPRVIVYLTDWSTNLNPSKYDLWLRFVFLHEYVHVLHLDIAEGVMRFYRFIFGRWVFPNALEPGFIIEGMPTYMETKYNPGGRGTDPRWDMMMRMDILENNVKSIDQAAVNTVRWPMGHLRYLYGVEFVEYLADTYGEDKLITVAHIYGDLFQYYGVDGAFLFVYRASLGMLWNEWLDYLHDKYTKQKEQLGELTVPKPVTDSGYYNLKPKWSKDSKRIYYQNRDADVYPNIRALDAGSGKNRKIFEGMVFDNSLALGPTGTKLLFSKSDIYKNYYTYQDLYVLDLENSRLSRLTEGGRAGDPDFSPDGSRIVFVKNEKGTRTLRLMRSDGSDLRMLCSYEANVQYFSPRWSPDGRKIVVAKWSPEKSQKIYLVSLATGEQQRLTQEEGLACESNPCFSPDGEYIIFDSDRTGIVNLYAYHLGSRQLYQITNVLGGAMMPDVSPDGEKLAYVSYSSRGYDVAMMKMEPPEWNYARPVPAETDQYAYREIRTKVKEITSDIKVEKKYEIHDYNPFPTLLPKFWLPLSYINENGSQTYIYTEGSDVLKQHLYKIQFGYDWDAERAQYAVYYANNQFLPQAAFVHSETAVPYSFDDSTLWMTERYGAVSFSLFDNRVFYEWDRQVFSFGYEQTNIKNISSIEALSAKPDLGDVNGVFLGWGYSSARQYPKSISPENGIDLALQVTMNSPDYGSDYTYTTYSGNSAAYLSPPFKHHVLVPKLYGFYSKGDQLEQSNFSWRYLPLRGYPSTNLKGNKGILLSTEYRFPLFYTESGFMYGATFFDRIWGNLFYDMGGATFQSISNLKLKKSYGMELNLNTSFGWGYYGMLLKLGYVKGLDEDGEEKFYFTIGL